MAKYKFPGKPPKTSQITRLRVSSNGSGSANDSSRLAAQQAAYGLKLFHQHFATDDEEEEDFIGFEKTIDGSFKPHFLVGSRKNKDFGVERQHQTELLSKVLSASCVPVVTSQHQHSLASKHSFDTWHERTSSVNWTNSASSCSQPHVKSADDNQLDRKLLEKSSKHAQPTKPVPSSKIIAPAKRILANDGDDIGKRDSSEDREKCRKPRLVATKQGQCPTGEENVDQAEKNRIKREIERYTSIMTTEVADSKQATDEKKKAKKSRSPSKDRDKAEKLRDKIQQLLRKQWESRLQLVDPKPEPQVPLESKTESQEGRGSSMSVSSSSASEEDRFYKRRRMNSNSSSSSSARKSKIILRKARLQLNQRLLKQLRQPSRLQQLVEPKSTQSVELPKTAQPSPSSILRPAQLVLQSPPVPVPRVPVALKEPAKLAKVPHPPAIKSSYVQKASEASTVTNPLGCAFVMEPSDTKGLPGTVVCGVCGAVRRYSFILQARKFGTFSCEPCRKFISRVLRARMPVKCTSGNGHCIHPPVLRWNNACPPEDRPASGEVMTARCKACWLKLALTGFQMRESDHDDLRKLLPTSMQDSIPLACDRPTNLHWAPNRGQMIRMKSSSSIPNVPVPSSSLPSSAAAATPKVKNKPAASKKAEHCPGSRTREKSGGGSGGSTTEIYSGPRVKHVCRSAVVARAQPRATFDDSASKQLDEPYDCCTLPDKSSLKISEAAASSLANESGSVQNSTKLSRSTDRKNSLSSPAMPLTTSQGERSRVTFRDDVKLGSNQRVGLMTSAVRAWQQQDLSRTKNSQFRCMTSGSAGRKPMKALPKGVLLPDLWEHYDADRVWDQGFAVCSSRLGMTSPLCFLCGSSGKNELVCCSSCCECFHPFCVADSAPLSNSVRPDCHHWDREAVVSRIKDDSKEVEKGDAAISVLTLNSGTPWICLNCVVCQICNSSLGERMVCSTCSHAYHWSCLGPAHPSSKRKRRSKWQCYTCSRIEDNFCPLCFKCHTNRQMKMECNCCGTWVHAECEELSEEDFRFLCATKAIEYVCSLCCPEKNWNNTLRYHAMQIFTEVLAKLTDVENKPSDELDVIREKVNRNEYRNCAEFNTDLRQFADHMGDSSILSLMPWTEIHPMKPVPQQKISITAKVDYEANSDIRICALCHGKGEGSATAEGRLLYCGNDIWTHVNCALWSNEVFEEVDGALQNVFDALARGSGSRCSHCNAKGATVNCCVRGCPVSLHFTCALQPEPGVTLLEGKRLICRYHASTKEQSNKSCVVHPPNFEVARCVYVDLGSEMKRMKPYASRDIRIVIGSLSVSSLGHLRTDVSGTLSALTPIGFECQRRYWSVKEPWKTVTYTLRTIYVPSTADGRDLETNVTVSHEEEDVIMAESGLNLAELDTQDDRDLIHMVLEDANFEQELEGEPNASLMMNTSNELRDSGFYSDGRSAGEVSPSPTEDNALEAWLADPEHAVIFLDSALLASLDIESDPALPTKSSTYSGNATEDVRHHTSNNYPQSPEHHSPPSKRNLRSKRLSYTQWKKMRLQNRKDKRAATTVETRSATPTSERPSTLDCNGNEAEWNNVSSNNLVASIKVSPLSQTTARNTINTEASWRRNGSSSNILQLDGAADSSDTEPEKTVVKVKLEKLSEDEPVKCRRCRRSYRTLQSFNKHTESCVEMLSSSGSDDESEAEIIPVIPKKEPVELDPISVPVEFHPKEEPVYVSEVTQPQLKHDPIQVPIVNSSSQAKSAEPKELSPTKPTSVHQPTPSKSAAVKSRTQRRRFRPNISAIPPRNIAIRQTLPPSQGVRFTVPAASAIPASYQVTLQSPPPPPPPPVLYVTRPELNSNNSTTLQCGFLSQSPLAMPQQHYIIMPPSIDQTFVQSNCGVPTLSSSGLTLTQHASSPMVQYLGAVPSNLLSALGIMTTNMGVSNYTVPSISTLLQSQSLQVPWDPPAVSNQIVILPQQPLLSFNLPSLSLQPAPQPAMPNIQLPSAPVEKKKSTMNEGNTPSKLDESTAVDSVLTTPVDCKTPETTEKQDAISASDKAAKPTEEQTELAEIPALKRPPEEQQCESDGKPPKPTYSYRSAMGGKKAYTPSPVGCEVKEDPPSSIVQQLKVVAHPSAPDKATRTFHLKAVSDNQETQNRMREEMVEMVASKMTEDTPETSDALADISDVFATPPASSEPPILPSDFDAEPISWPVIDSTLPSEEIKPPENGGKKRKEAHILYELVSDDGFHAQSESLSAVWQKLLDAVQDARLAFKMEPLYNGCLKSVDERSLHLTGLHHHALINLLEQLPNADQFSEYTFRYRDQRHLDSAEKLITESAFGCVRASPFTSREPYDMFGWLASQYRPRPQLSTRATTDLDSTQQPAGRRVTNFELLPMTVRFKHLRQVAKNSVGVFRSHIHGRGLFCTRDIECGEMVVEYAGQVIRSVLCDKREKEYEAKGMGCYMFRIDEQTVVDATVHGNAARFINHSCEPNCYSRIVDIFGMKHIIIFALRRIHRGEELTYDYKFPLEDVKIPCTCGSRKCRKYLN